MYASPQDPKSLAFITESLDIGASTVLTACHLGLLITADPNVID